MSSTRLRLIAAALAALPVSTLAEESRLSEMTVAAPKLPSLAATAARVSQTDLQTGRVTSSDTASLLRDVPGLALQGAGGVSSLPVVHGLADDRLRIKVDGMDLLASCPNHMNPALSYLDPAQVGALKVYAGLAPVSVGGDSIGGSIVAESKSPEFAESAEHLLFKGEAGTFYRSNNDARGANLSATYATERFSLNYAGAYSEAQNYHAAKAFKTSAATGRAGHTLGLDEVGSTAYRTSNHSLGLAMKQEHHLFEARLGYQDMPKQLFPNQRMDLLDNQQRSINLRYLGQFDWGRLETRAYHERVDHRMDFGPDKRYWYGTASGGPAALNGTPCSPAGSNTCANGMPMLTAGKTTGALLKADILLADEAILRVGGEMQHYRLDDWWTPSGSGMAPETFWNINDGQRDRNALFAEWESRPAAQWQTLLGARYERVSSDAGQVQGYSPTVNSTVMGMMTMWSNQQSDAARFNARERDRLDHNWDAVALARYTVDATQDIEFGLARKVRSPNLYERYTWSTWSMAALMNNYAGDGNAYVGNVDLKPEKAHTVSATFDWHGAAREWEFKATPYYTHVSDYIDAIRCPVNNQTCTAANASATNRFVTLQYANQSARLYGLDLSGRLPLGRNELGQWGLKGLLNYTRGRNRDTGDALYNIMPLNAKLTLTRQQGGWDNALEWVGVKGKQDTSDVRNEIRTSGYTLVNLRASYRWQQWRLEMGVENLFDRFYYLPLGGAYNAQGTTMATTGSSSPAWGVAVPGMGRAFYAGLNLSF